MPRAIRSCLPPLLLLCVLAHPALAVWSNDPDANLMVTNSANDQGYPVACSDGAGGVIVAWEDFRNGTDWNIYAQHISHDGKPLWTANGRVICNSPFTQWYLSICSDGEGGAIIAWKDRRSDTNFDIYAQRVNSSGTPLWTANGVALCTNTAEQEQPFLCSDGSGGAIAVWTDFRGADANIYARRVNSAGTPQWVANGIAVCSAAGSQGRPRIVADGYGGAIMVWEDQRNGNLDIYGQHLNSSATALWAAGGLAICSEASAQDQVALASDARGGAYVAWRDARGGNADIYVEKMSYSGSSLWSNGVAVCDQSGTQQGPSLTADGEYGAIVTWEDGRGLDANIYAQRIREDGFLQWTDNGVSVCTATGDQAMPSAVPDGAGGAVIAWTDGRVGADHLYARRVSDLGAALWSSNGVALSLIAATDPACLVEDGEGGAILLFGGNPMAVGDYDVYAQNVDRFGALGNAAPAISRVSDVRADQGGRVLIEWAPSYRDADPTFAIDAYSVWRQVPSAPPLARAAAAIGAGRRAMRTTVQGAATLYWEYVGEQPARGRDGYSFVAPTTTDSLAGSNPYTRFMVSAEESGGTPYWDSAPDSGYSADNLSPPAPAPFTGEYASGSTALQWGESPAPDLAVYRLYRGPTAGFTPDAGSHVATTTARVYSDVAGGPYFYKLCAVDVHDNVSPYAFLQPAGTVDVPGALPRELALSAPAPNPLRSASTLRLALPRAARVELAIYDQQGRRVRALHSGVRPAGEHSLVWDGHGENGRAVPSGVYFLCCVVEGRTLTRRLAVVR